MINLEPFQIIHPDLECSHVTGMARRHWIDAGKHILGGVFAHVASPDAPMLLPKRPGVSYPRDGNEAAPQAEKMSAVFEALSRTFNIAAPLLREEPGLRLNGIPLADYYRRWFLEMMTDEASPWFITKAATKTHPLQQTCELGNIAMWGLLAPEVFWDRLDAAEKDLVAATLREWSEAHTVQHNWRWFNVMMITFLLKNGYQADRELMVNHLDNLLLHHAGGGWFRDLGYDYYTVHVFQLYGAVWNRHFGEAHEPERAAMIAAQFEQFTATYPRIFGRGGRVNMYGRSVLYRMGALAGIAAGQLRVGGSGLDAGFARQIASGGLLQFIAHPKFFDEGIPALGFYGHFEQAIQAYSCSASVYWMFLPFSLLLLGEEHPFWREKENEGFWPGLGERSDSEPLGGSGIVATVHGLSGASELRPGKIIKRDPNYNRLTYSTAFPWEARPITGPVSCQFEIYRFDPGDYAPRPEDWEQPDHVDFCGWRAGVLYRQIAFSGAHRSTKIDLASVIIPGGEIQVLRLRKATGLKLRYGHFSVPHSAMDGVTKTDVAFPGAERAVLIENGERWTLCAAVLGWHLLETRTAEGCHPEERFSSLAYVEHEDRRRYGPVEILCTVLLSGIHPGPEDTGLELAKFVSVQEIVPSEAGGLLTLQPFSLVLSDGRRIEIDFTDMDGRSTRH